MSVDPASVGDAVDSAIANQAPITDAQAMSQGPILNWTDIPDLPPELQPSPGDILLKQPIWPWEDLGAQGIPEHWLYMSRRVQGTVALLAVQTPNGPRLVNANPDGTLVQVPQATPTPINIPTFVTEIGIVVNAVSNSLGLLGIDPTDYRDVYWYYASLELESAIATNDWMLKFGIQSPFARFSTGIAGPRIINLGGSKMSRAHVPGNVEDLEIVNNGNAPIAIKGYVAYTLA